MLILIILFGMMVYNAFSNEAFNDKKYFHMLIILIKKIGICPNM